MGCCKWFIVSLGVFLSMVPLLFEERFHKGFFYTQKEQNSAFPDRDYKNLDHTAGALKKSISKTDLDKFHKDGYVVIKGNLDDKLVSKITDAASHARDNPSSYFQYFRYAFKEMFMTYRSDFWRDLTFFSPISRIAKEFMHPGTTGVYVAAEGMWAKQPGVAAKVNQGDDKNWTLTFHADRLESPIDTDNCINFWLALKPVTDADSPLLIIPGSHEIYGAQRAALMREPDELDSAVYKTTAPMQPGDVIAMNCSTLHGSDALGQTSKGRLAYTWWFAGDTDKRPVNYVKEQMRFGKYCQHSFWAGLYDEMTKLSETDCYFRVLPTRMEHQMKAREEEKCGPNTYRIPLYIYGFIKNIYFYVFTNVRTDLS